VEDVEAGRAEAIQELLPLLDDLDRAIDHIPADLTDHPWARGVMLIGLNLESALSRLGVERFGARGDLFDPHLHEAIEYEPRDDVAAEHVARVVRPGYRSGERLLRAAQVVVARAVPPSGSIVDSRI
jgi:molecular chaperone GrpE